MSNQAVIGVDDMPCSCARGCPNGANGCRCRVQRNCMNSVCNNHTAAITAAQTAAEMRNASHVCICCKCGRECNNAPENIADSFYTNVNACNIRTNPPICTSCCDPYNGCALYPLAKRNPFWPTFAHPRWLSCAALYSCNCR